MCLRELYFHGYRFLGSEEGYLFVEDTVVVELKSVQHTIKDHEVQLVNYLKGLKRDIWDDNVETQILNLTYPNYTLLVC